MPATLRPDEPAHTDMSRQATPADPPAASPTLPLGMRPPAAAWQLPAGVAAPAPVNAPAAASPAPARSSAASAPPPTSASAPPPTSPPSPSSRLTAPLTSPASRGSAPPGRAEAAPAPLPAPPSNSPAAPPAAVLRAIDRGDYEILAPFAEGGIGRILRARDRHLERQVALKELRTRSQGAEERFVREALLTARLQHPGIVPIYEAGRWPSGEPFYAMKLVAGRPLSERIHEAQTLDQRLALLPHVLAVAQTMGYAHSQRVIHRDLKPENVLLGEYGETVVIDWGLAKDLSIPEPTRAPPPPRPGERATSTGSSGRRRVGTSKSLTLDGAVMGTPAYMPPEQAYGDPVDERADVYAIGAILYHLIAGEPPYDGDTPVDILVKVTSVEPVPIEERQPGIPRELATILRKAMAERPEDRYPTAKELADDLRRFQAGQLVAAHHYSRGERLRRLLRRYRAPLGVGAIALVLLGLLGAVSLARIFAARDAAEAARGEAERRADELALEHARSAAETEPARALELLAQLRDKSQWQRLRTIAADARAHGLATALVGHRAGISRVVFSPDGRYLVTTSDDCSARIWDLETRESRPLVGHRDEVWRAAFSPDGSRLATTSRDASLRIWDVATGAPVQDLRGHERGTRALAFTRDGAAILTGGDDDRLLRWDLATGASTELAHCLAGAFSANGRQVACADVSRRGVTLFDLEDGTRHHLDLEGGISPAVELSPTREELAVSTHFGVVVWAWREGQVRALDGPPISIRTLSYSPDGRTLAASTFAHRVRLWRDGERLDDLVHTGGGLRRLVFTHDGRHLLGAGGDTKIHAWRLADGRQHTFTGFRDSVSALAVSPDDRRLAAASTDGDTRIFDLSVLRGERLGDIGAAGVALPHLGRGFVGHEDGRIETWDLQLTRGDHPDRVIRPRPVGVASLAPLADGERLVVASVDGYLGVHAADGALIRELAPPGESPIRHLRASPGGRFVLGAHTGIEKTLAWDLTTGERQDLGISTNTEGVWLDDKTFASAYQSREVTAHDLEAGTRTVLLEDDLKLRALALTPDGRYILTAGASHTIHAIDRATGEDRKTNLPSLANVTAIAPIPGTNRALIAANQIRIEIWDYIEGTRVGELLGSDVPVSAVWVAPDGHRAISASEDRYIRFWDLEFGESRVLGHTEDVPAYNVAFTPDGVVVSAGSLYTWADNLPQDANTFLGWLRLSQSELTLTAPPVDIACAPLDAP